MVVISLIATSTFAYPLAEERNFRSAKNNLAQCTTWEGLIPRKRRRILEPFLLHPNPLIRAIAHETHAKDARVRRWMRGDYEIGDPGEFTGDVNFDFDIAAAFDADNAIIFDPKFCPK